MQKSELVLMKELRILRCLIIKLIYVLLSHRFYCSFKNPNQFINNLTLITCSNHPSSCKRTHDLRRRKHYLEDDHQEVILYPVPKYSYKLRSVNFYKILEVKQIRKLTNNNYLKRLFRNSFSNNLFN